ncbi:MAG: DUF5701 family protein [bacterium]|nr:DUF5701 family protein [bacterium]
MHYNMRCAFMLFIAMIGVNADERPSGRMWEAEDLKTRYIAQVARLRALGYPAMFGGDSLFEERFKADRQPWSPYKSVYEELFKTTPVWVDDGNIPMLIVVPRNCAPLRWQATRVMIDGVKSDAPQFELSRVQDIADSPALQRPYILFNVNPGADTYTTSVHGAENDLKNMHRRGLTFAEGIALLAQYPDVMKCNRGINEDYRERFAFGRVVFLGASYGGACPCDNTAEEFITFKVRKHQGDGFARGYFTPVIRRDMTPNYSRFLFPSCEAE